MISKKLHIVFLSLALLLLLCGCGNVEDNADTPYNEEKIMLLQNEKQKVVEDETVITESESVEKEQEAKVETETFEEENSNKQKNDAVEKKAADNPDLKKMDITKQEVRTLPKDVKASPKAEVAEPEPEKTATSIKRSASVSQTDKQKVNKKEQVSKRVDNNGEVKKENKTAPKSSDKENTVTSKSQKNVKAKSSTETAEKRKEMQVDNAKTETSENPLNEPKKSEEKVLQESEESIVQETENKDVPKSSEKEQRKKKNICTLTVKCDTILSNMDNLAKEKVPLVPPNGVIYSSNELEFQQGDSVFDVLYREMKSKGIHLEFNETPAYKSVYVEGINNLYEFDCGDLSGWMYMVNGKPGSLGCSQYVVQPGDRIEWVYTCDMGRDVR